ncbi:hypothetical protein AGABI1DRAFT_120446 [Agaricus bisporus var. burnettii JB137-S8]|uniref:FAD-binding PCMH-type domain-containing protein n=1 Tax=Agaricus bisporus var. burnettii (strain JB137-S8 / ATCC MYA-4627 / FGSC 10392) TaxID=597362 RepID=K5XYI5_AGABU|nr:uncharacterized protein AGABI1DRAFT_120446 [Agaricus bisporus var. burnettii JB137-S8]EKM80430.1 hypothetical protein AGABI1DRAFT_120446 [Agaricus bisporus var. burnettii JB137-S8]
MSSLADFSALIKGDVIVPGHAEYEKSLKRWAVNAEKKAAVVVFIKDEADAAAAILYARKNDLPIAIRGGGHSPAGASSIDGGLVIDLSRYLTGVKVDPKKKLAYVGGGAIWETVDKTAIEYGLATVGGTVNHVCDFIQLALGGGFGFLTGEHGLVVDNIVQVTLVSANGTIYTVNEKENTDLFFGIRGGGCNFGVVTELVLALHSQRRTVFTGPLIFPVIHLERVVEFAEKWYANIRSNEAMFLVLDGKPGTAPNIICHVFYNGSEEEGRSRFKGLYEIGPVMDMSKEIPYEMVNSLQNSIIVPGSGVYWKGVAIPGPSYKPIANTYAKVQEISKSGTFSTLAVYELLPLQKINSVPLNTTAYRRSTNPNCLLSLNWPRDLNSQALVDEARSLTHQLAACVAGGASELEDEKSRPYANYDAEGDARSQEEVKKIAHVAFGDNYPALQKIKKIYDPENIFNRWFSIIPA